MKKTTYKESGVDIEASEGFVEKIKHIVGKDPRGRAHTGIGGFAALYDMGPDRPLLAASTDGVGTKLKWTFLTGEHRAIGLDLVAMSVNDILCTGATPLFFLDYLATGKLNGEEALSVVEGIVEGCSRAKAFLIGGETAEMPGMYRPGEYDLAGFAIGEVSRENLVDARKLAIGDTMVGLASSGLHANGFSLARKLVADSEVEIIKEAMAPTVIYVPLVEKLLAQRGLVSALAHITGGGWNNLARVSPLFDYPVHYYPPLGDIPPIFSLLKNRSGLPPEELYGVFNMGVGFVVFTPKPSRVQQMARDLGVNSWVLGKIRQGQGRVIY